MVMKKKNTNTTEDVLVISSSSSSASEEEEEEVEEESEEEEEEVKSSNNSNQQDIEEIMEIDEDNSMKNKNKMKMKQKNKAVHVTTDNVTGSCVFPTNRINRIIRSEGTDFRITQEAIFLVNKATVVVDFMILQCYLHLRMSSYWESAGAIF
ncbi:hypothetical protein AQUCO_02700046v1 [Aquilegia coerulea]|uniref:Uncharacterized protein n=1 Tax=Aquilegia coerulea TaxID=218851 RepID=A0A2G5D4X9_AQUCA|nr:hypothetical protein AQUCO_02700046v1 [Aquilegia coerulea]